MPTNRKLVILNQASNYLTIGFANAFKKEFDEVVLMTGSIHVQGEELDSQIKIQSINRWYESPASKKMKSYFLAMFKMWWLLMTRFRKHEVYFVSVPPMGYLLNIFLPHRFSMVIWDVYPDVFKITGMRESHPVYRIWAWLNRRSFKKAYRIFTISEKMAELLYQYVSPSKVLVQPIWSIFQENKKVSKSENPFIQKHNLQGKFIIQYSGNIGLTHNVEALVDIAELLQEESNILFQIIGRGPRKDVLERVVKERQLPNCQFLPFQSDEMFPFSLGAADMGVVILDESISKGSVPSKSFNLMSLGIPSLYIASPDSQLKGYAESYGHALCFTKSELKEAAEAIKRLVSDRQALERMSVQAESAAKNFTRCNADRFVAKYFSTE